jgi:hypothetical protein
VNDRDLYAFGPEVVFEEGVYATARKNESGEYEVVMGEEDTNIQSSE